VINLRGRVVPVVDLAVKLGLPESQITKRTCVVVVEVDLEGERSVMGVLADSVSQVLDLPQGEIEPPPPFGPRVRVECLVGMGRAGKRFVLLLDIDKLLSLDELSVAAQLDAAATPVTDAPATGAAT
jgi:purine-binding chemotaxis protein CheW